jgi:hypothetical protein
VALFTVEEAYQAADRVSVRSGRTADSILNEHQKLAKARSSFDIFLSHSSTDKRFIVGAKQILEDQFFSVYVDWIDDPQLDRSHVTSATAAVLRERMKSCKSFLFATSSTSSSSKWMPWEIGYFDGLRGERIAIFPLTSGIDKTFAGQEYLGLYPYVEKIEDTMSSRRTLGLNKRAGLYLPLDNFVSGSPLYKAGYS